MTRPLMYDIVESPLHPDLGAPASRYGLERLVFTSQRRAIAQLKKRPPSVVAADFFYGYGSNYAGANVSNLDVLLRGVQRFAPEAKTIVFADRHELPHTDKLAALFDLHRIVALPADERQLEQLLAGIRL